MSDSVSLAARERAYRFVAEAVKSMKPGDRQSLIVFGDAAVVDQQLSSRPTLDRPKSEVDGRGTNIFQAIQLALAVLPPGHANRIVMLTDGRQNAGNALAGAQAAKNAGSDIHYVAAPLTFTQEVVAEALAGALRSQNIEVTVVEPPQLPTDLAGLQKYDGIVLSNVSSLKLTRTQMTHIRDYVRDGGGGLLMVGGEESFGLGGYYRTPIEEALPVTMEVKQKVEIPSLAVVLSIDRSGSMAMATDEKVTKLDLAKEAAHLVVDLLDERNEVGVMSWDTEFVWDAPVRPARDRQAIHHAIATIKAGGGTDGYPALKEAYAGRFDRTALLKHVIFLSDGQMTRGDFQGLLRRMAKDKITVSTVAIGKDADVQLMVDVAKWGKGRFYYTEDSQTIPRIFTLETQLASKASLV